MKYLLSLIFFLIITDIYAQDAELDKNFYVSWDGKYYTILNVYCPPPGLHLVVAIYNVNYPMKEIINQELDTENEEWVSFKVDVTNLPVGLYYIEVHLGIEWSKTLKMFVKKRNVKSNSQI